MNSFVYANEFILNSYQAHEHLAIQGENCEMIMYIQRVYLLKHFHDAHNGLECLLKILIFGISSVLMGIRSSLNEGSAEENMNESKKN